MRQSAIRCYMCVYPDVLNFVSHERAPPPPWVRGAISERERRCTKCGGPIRKGEGFVYVCGRDPVDGEAELHAALCGRPDA